MEFIVLILLIFINGLLSMAEIALVSARKSKLQQMSADGNEEAKKALAIAKSPSHFLSTVQVGITLVGILSGAFAEATITQDIASFLSTVPFIEPYSNLVAFILVVIGITYLSLIMGELVPKQLGLLNPEKVASMVAKPMNLLSEVMYPFVYFLSSSTDAILKLFNIKPLKENPVTEDEIKVLIQEGTRAGIFEKAEEEIVRRVLRLGDRRVNSLMTPRSEIISIDITDSLSKIKKTILSATHSHFPITKKDMDEVIGVVLLEDVSKKYLADEDFNIREIMKEPFFIPESMFALRALELFKDTGVTNALVTDEYGSVQGLITVKDMLEAIVGDIHSPHEEHDPLIVKRGKDAYIIDGMLSIDDFKELFKLKKLPKEGTGAYETIGGFVIAQLERIPKTGDTLKWNEIIFEVVDMDNNRVDKILVTKIPTEEK